MRHFSRDVPNVDREPPCANNWNEVEELVLDEIELWKRDQEFRPPRIAGH
jgi:hypothetical protein